MKSIGNGWKRAQEAQKLARQVKLAEEMNAEYWANYSRAYVQSTAPLATSNPLAELLAQHSKMTQYGEGLRAMSPEAMKEKAEREAPLSQNAYAGTWVQTPEPEPEPTLWKRIKRALR